MEPYERSISLKTIWLTIIRRWVGIVLIFAPIALASYIVTQKIMTKTYSSSIDLNNTAVVTTPQHSILASAIKDKSLSYTVTIPAEEEGGEATTETVYVFPEAARLLAAEGIKNSNGKAITPEEIISGYSILGLASNSLKVTLSFTSKDNAIPKLILDTATPLIYKAAEPRITGTKAFVVSEASAVAKISKENTYLFIGLAAGFIVACALPFIDEIVSDEVYDAKDVRMLGCDGFEIKANKKVAQ